MNFKYDITYVSDGNEYKSVSNKTPFFTLNENQIGEIFSLTLTPQKAVSFKKLSMTADIQFDEKCKIFVNGYQSWTLSREYEADEAMNDFSPRFLGIEKRKINPLGIWGAGDLTFHNYPEKPRVFYGYSYAYIRNGSSLRLLGSLSERTGYTVITFDAEKSTVTIEKDLEGVTYLPKKEYKLLDLADISGQYDDVFDRYFELMSIKKPDAGKMCGYTTWYNYYTGVTEEIVKRDLKAISQLDTKIDIFQIDDGYERTVGDWLVTDKKKFPSGMKTVADEIHKNNMLAGIWLAPFAATPKSYVYKQHKDWFIKNKKGKIPFASHNWGGFFALDIYNPEVRKYLKKVFTTVLDIWGYDMVKLDFLYACCRIPYNNKSRGEIMCDAMELIREYCGDKLILGCGVPLHPAFGKVDFCRIGADIALSWDKKPFSREDVSTKNTLMNTVFRRHLDGRAFLNDPDVFLLRDENIKMPLSKRKIIAEVDSLCGNLLFVSDDVSTYNAQQKAIFNDTVTKNKAKIISSEMNGNGDIIIDYTFDSKRKSFCFNINDGTLK